MCVISSRSLRIALHSNSSTLIICRVIDNFMQYGTVHDQRHDFPDLSNTMTTEEDVEKTEKFLIKNPNVSIQKAAQALKISNTSLHMILQNFLKMPPFKITTHQLLTEELMAKRIEFCEIFTEIFEDGQLHENQIIFLDKAYFSLDGYVTKQNCRVWGTENPYLTKAKVRPDNNVTVWAAMSVKEIYLHFFDSTLTNESYTQFLETKFLPLAKKRGLVNKLYFMQDETMPHQTQEVLQAIHKVYGNRAIGQEYPKFAHGGIAWPPYSPDLNPCDYFLWGHIKDHCYTNKPRTNEELITVIKKVVGDIKTDILERVFYSFRKRLDYCANSNGAHFENIYH